MQITFLGHDGFFVELPAHCLLFDWWKGPLPQKPPEKPLLVFVSHRHQDHFNPEVFRLAGDGVLFFLGSDFHLTPKNRERWGLDADAAGRCRRCGKHDLLNPLPGVRVETFPSTDEGVAWMVTAEGRSIFHAGDLNWWYWEEEGPEWNRNMAALFHRYTEPLAGRRAEVAMLPLDPRLKDPALGPLHFLQLMEVSHFLPMHQWEDPACTRRFLRAHPEYAAITHPTERSGQVIEIP